MNEGRHQLDLDAKAYVENYRNKIKEFHDKGENELANILKTDPEKNKTLESITIRRTMKDFIKELQKDENYEKLTRVYHQDMKQIHNFNQEFHDYTKKSEKQNMRQHLDDAKTNFFDKDTEKWTKFVQSYKKVWNKFSPEQKSHISSEVTKMMNDKVYFNKQIDTFLKNIKKIDLESIYLNCNPLAIVSLPFLAGGIGSLVGGLATGSEASMVVGAIVAFLGSILPTKEVISEYVDISKEHVKS